MLEADGQGSVAFAVCDIGAFNLLEEVKDREEEAFLAGIVERSPLVEINYVEVYVWLG